MNIYFVLISILFLFLCFRYYLEVSNYFFAYLYQERVKLEIMADTQETVWIAFDLLNSFITDVFKGLAVPDEDAEICADVVLAADKRGIDSHGTARLKQFYYDRIKEGIQEPVTDFQIVREGFTTAVVDGNNGMGQVIAKKSMDLAIKKASEYGMGMVAVKNSTHYGIAGYYVNMAIEAGMIGMTGTNARPSIAPTFGVDNMLGTNPLAIGMPSDDEFPFIIDAATSVAQRGKIEVYARENKAMPPGWVIGEDGNDRIDAVQTLIDLSEGTAALAPLGGIGEETAGYKGYGYATAVEILSAALQGGNFLKMLMGIDNGKKVPFGLGHFFIAVDIKCFAEIDDFRKRTGDILRTLRASRKAPGHERIYTAGEKEYLAWLERRDKGVPVSKVLQKDINAMKNELKLDKYSFPF